jgi:hypothetical protein
MLHRHLNHERYTLAALDDLIERGKREDWAKLRSVALENRAIMEKILRIALRHAQDPYAQRCHFWRQYAEKHLNAV